MVEILAHTRRWIRVLVGLFVAVFGLAGAGLVVVLATTKGHSRLLIMSLLPMLLVLAAYVPSVVLLGRYAGGIRRLQGGAGMPALEQALGSQKNFWKYVCILNIVLVLAYFLALASTGVLGRPFL